MDKDKSTKENLENALNSASNDKNFMESMNTLFSTFLSNVPDEIFPDENDEFPNSDKMNEIIKELNEVIPENPFGNLIKEILPTDLTISSSMKQEEVIELLSNKDNMMDNLNGIIKRGLHDNCSCTECMPDISVENLEELKNSINADFANITELGQEIVDNLMNNTDNPFIEEND